MTVKGDPIADLERHGPRPVYAIDGEERFLVDEAVERIKAKAVPARARDFNQDVFFGRSVKLSRVLDAARTLPAFADRRLVLVTQAEKLDLEGSEAQELLAYLEAPNKSTVLVFVADRFDARTRIYKAFQKAGAVLRFDRPRPREMPDLIRKRAELTGCRIEPPAARALAETFGTDLGGAIQALEVLSLFVGPSSGRAIGVGDVEAVISSTKEESIFALVDAIGHGDLGAALRGLHGILGISREPPLRALAMIARHYRHLLRARIGLDLGRPSAAIQAEVGVPPFVMDGLLSQARRASARALAGGLVAIGRADRALKGGRLDHQRSMERLVLDLVGISRPSKA